MKSLNCKFVIHLILAMAISAYNSALAESDIDGTNLSFTPRASIGYLSYNADQLGTDFNFDYIFGGLGLSAQYGRFFVDLYGQTDLKEFDEEDNNADFGDGRKELNLTAGYGVTSNITLFGGYKYADTDFIDLQYGGPFLGASFSIPVFELGAIGLNGAVAYLEEFNTEGEDFDTTSVGVNGGVSWASNLAWLLPGLGYGLNFDYSYYEFDDSGDTILTEKIFRTRLDLKYTF